jgi:hypothetical protein
MIAVKDCSSPLKLRISRRASPGIEAVEVERMAGVLCHKRHEAELRAAVTREQH